MALELIGPHPFECDATGRQRTRVGTVFPFRRTLITLPGIHASQRLEFIDRMNEARTAGGGPPLTEAEVEEEYMRSVDLIFDANRILIRPDPEHMELAFAADELLQELVSKRDIKFLFVVDRKVRDAIKARGECWRISPLPQSHEGIRRLIENARVAICEQPVYFFNRFTGSRYLTCGEFSRLDRLDDESLARQMREIAEYSSRQNRHDYPEIDFFAADLARFNSASFQALDMARLSGAELRELYRHLRGLFREAVEPDFQQDDPAMEVWRSRMLSTLLSRRDQTITEDVLRDLSPEFFMHVEWLPGGRFEEGEFIPDPLFDEVDQHPADEQLQHLCDPIVRSFIFNFIREFGALDYVNVGRIFESLSKARPLVGGRRGVYLAELQLRGATKPLVRFIRFQKWGIRERLDDGKPLLEAILKSEEYTDYVLDRRLGVLQLGMNVPAGLSLQRTRERYIRANHEVSGQLIPVLYFERDYLHGIATDKLPRSKYLKPGYAGRLAGLLGWAAASNMIAGRALEKTKQALFDDGDEVVMENPANGLPDRLVVSDPSGAFCDYQRDLIEAAPDYARPVNARADFTPDARGFAETYLAAFEAGFLHVQGDYRRYRRAFDTLFKHCFYDPAGSFAYRWECVLRRLDQTDVDVLVRRIRREIAVLNDGAPATALPSPGWPRSDP
jgi:hypothetical protein